MSGARAVGPVGGREQVASEIVFVFEPASPGLECNTALLLGPTGSGKTCAVFALAAELGFNVLEVRLLDCSISYINIS